MKVKLDESLPQYSIWLGGISSIDVTKKGTDKAYSIRKIREIFGVQFSEMIFVGDALFPDANDYPAK
ncbi:HAD hydrolase family protein [Rubripirellula reticaptiva]|uniref:Phosphomannomutase n=1 Tax=Rubripirellula reticaptiva TaxID=2528013 RepID=A0A5C6EGL0_9BACT|nr:HAD hydrolase family protein [Rubripirellula reticaptiva]TWU46851.1 hypothetical protein Poly59_58240 [Rubripirellula reticaptiva]